MTDKFFTSLSNTLADGRLGHAVDVLTKKCALSAAAHPDLNNLLPALEKIADTYSRMRQFMLEGSPDPDRDSVYDSLANHLREIARDYLFIVNEDRLDALFSDYRLQKVRNRSIADMLDEIEKNEHRRTMAEVTEADPQQFVKKKEEITVNIFLKTFSLPPWAKADREALKHALADPNLEFALKSQIISGLLLGLLKFYDPGKFSLLLNAYQNETDEKLAARLLTAIVLVLHRNGTSVLYDKHIKEALSELSDSILTYTRLRDVVKTLIKTRDTDRVSREVSDAFNTTMRNIDPRILEKLQREGLSIDASETGMNPEWEKIMKNKELEEKMQRINDMQLEGMDVMMQTFSKLKSFSFFRRLPNWFLPFSPSHSDITRLFETFDATGFSAMADATDMCASDRYSFSFGILQMPEERRNILSATLGAQLEGLRDMLKDRENVGRKPEFATEALVYARDLYRFAKVYPDRREFYDPFEEPLDFLRLPVLGSLLAEDEIILTAADFYFAHGYYALALPLYERLAGSLTNSDVDSSLFEKIGYCSQMGGDFVKALENYEKADLFSTDIQKSSTWLLKKLAFCNKTLGYYGKAAEFYEKVLERHPDDLNLEYHLGSVLLRAGDVKRAKELLSKVNYLNPDHQLCSRLYARLKGHEAFLSGKYKEALDLYDKARGDRDSNSFLRDVQAELSLINPDFDLRTLQILFDC